MYLGTCNLCAMQPSTCALPAWEPVSRASSPPEHRSTYAEKALLCRKGFAIFFTAGNLSSIAATCFIVGPKKQLQNMLTNQRMAACGAYFGAMALTLFVALRVRLLSLMYSHCCSRSQ